MLLLRGPQKLFFSEEAHREQAFKGGPPSSQRLGDQGRMLGDASPRPAPPLVRREQSLVMR